MVAVQERRDGQICEIYIDENIDFDVGPLRCEHDWRSSRVDVKGET
jgi:hypothetical protein